MLCGHAVIREADEDFFTRVTILRAKQSLKLGASTDARLFAKTNNKQDNMGNGI